MRNPQLRSWICLYRNEMKFPTLLVSFLYFSKRIQLPNIFFIRNEQFQEITARGRYWILAPICIWKLPQFWQKMKIWQFIQNDWRGRRRCPVRCMMYKVLKFSFAGPETLERILVLCHEKWVLKGRAVTQSPPTFYSLTIAKLSKVLMGIQFQKLFFWLKFGCIGSMPNPP